jgi:hypothetical protein
LFFPPAFGCCDAALSRPALEASLASSVAEELEGFELAEQLETERAAEVPFQQRRRLLKVREHP